MRAIAQDLHLIRSRYLRTRSEGGSFSYFGDKPQGINDSRARGRAYIRLLLAGESGVGVRVVPSLFGGLGVRVLWCSLYFSGGYIYGIPLGKKRLTLADKKRIIRKEVEAYGSVRKGSYAAEVQKKVDKGRSK